MSAKYKYILLHDSYLFLVEAVLEREGGGPGGVPGVLDALRPANLAPCPPDTALQTGPFMI